MASSNFRMRTWRQNAELSRSEMAKSLNLTASGIKYRLACDEERVRRWEAGEVCWPREPYRMALGELTNRTPEELGFVPTKRGGRPDTRAAPTAVIFGMEIDLPSDQASGINKIATALVAYSPETVGPTDLDLLAAMVARTKHGYQGSQYTQVIADLPALLMGVQIACATLDGDARLRALALSTAAHHLTASIMLKQEIGGLAWAASLDVMCEPEMLQLTGLTERECQQISLDNYRALVAYAPDLPWAAPLQGWTRTAHARMVGEHYEVAVSTAGAAVRRMDDLMAQPTGDELSVYGALLLIGAVAAARLGDRHKVAELLTEAEAAADRLGYDGNHQWTAFGPANVLCHRANIALRLGDAGTAIDQARLVNLGHLPSSERRGSLLLNTAEAFLTCGNHEKALYVMQCAGEVAREEVSGRPGGVRLALAIAATAPISIRREAREYAASLGVAT